MKFLESIIVVRVFNKFISNFSAIDTHKHLFFKHSSDHQTSNNFVKFGDISMAYSREVVYVKDFLNDFRQYEFD